MVPIFAEEANNAVFNNGQHNCAINSDILTLSDKHDLVYIDPPYLSAQGVGVDYWEFYHFLEGLTLYDEWKEHIDFKSKHHRLKRRASEWTNKQLIGSAFEKVFQKSQNSIIVVSYRSDGIPSIEELVALLQKYKRNVRVEQYGQYKYVLSANGETQRSVVDRE